MDYIQRALLFYFDLSELVESLDQIGFSRCTIFLFNMLYIVMQSYQDSSKKETLYEPKTYEPND